MNNNDQNPGRTSILIYVIATAGCFLIVGWLVTLMVKKTAPKPMGTDRGAERQKTLADIRASETQILKNYEWQDQAKGLIRLPIERAMELTVHEWKNPAAARSNLIASSQKASAVPPKPPEKPNQYE